MSEEFLSDIEKRQEISRLLRQAASLCDVSMEATLQGGFPILRRATGIAKDLEERVPYILCMNQLAWLHSVSGDGRAAFQTIRRSLEIAQSECNDPDILQQTTYQFIDLALVTGQEIDRATAFALGLFQQAAEEEQDFTAVFQATTKLGTLCADAQKQYAEGIALYSWLQIRTRQFMPELLPEVETLYQRIALKVPQELRPQKLSEWEANRDDLLRKVTKGFLPDHEPEWLR